jgi:uncharacterized protein (DUF1778 family)
MDLEQPAEAEKMIEEAAAISSKSRDPDLLNGANAIATDIQVVRASITLGRSDYRTAIDLVTKAHASVASALALGNQKRVVELVALFQLAFDLDKPFSAQREQRIAPERIILLNNLANVEFELDRLDAAQDLMKQSAEGARVIFRADSLQHAES